MESVIKFSSIGFLVPSFFSNSLLISDLYGNNKNEILFSDSDCLVCVGEKRREFKNEIDVVSSNSNYAIDAKNSFCCFPFKSKKIQKSENEHQIVKSTTTMPSSVNDIQKHSGVPVAVADFRGE